MLFQSFLLFTCFLSLGRHFVILTIWGLINMFSVLWRLSVWNCQIDFETFLLRAIHNWTSRVKVGSSVLHECLKFPATIFQEIHWPSLQNVGILFLVPLLIRFPVSANDLIQDAPIKSESWNLLSTPAGGEFPMDLNLFLCFGIYDDIKAGLFSSFLRCPVIALARGAANLHTSLSCQRVA